MDRLEQLHAFIAQHDNVNFNATNIPKVLTNLEQADKDGCLKQFLLNKKPYQSAFPFFVFNGQRQAARGKDQCAIVFALNLYGAKNPGFVFRLHTLLKELAKGSAKEVSAVMVLRNAQLELQSLGISLIDFFDTELLTMLDTFITRNKAPRILLDILLICGGAIGAPGFAIMGAVLLSPVAGFLMCYGFVRLVFWIAIKPMGADAIRTAAKDPQEYTDSLCQ